MSIVATAVTLAAAIAAPEMTPVERLNAELLAGRTATETLERRCAALGLATHPRVHAEVDRTSPAPDAPPAVRERLGVATGTQLGYRRVRLMCGPLVLSEAENWYVPSRLSPAMNAALADGDAPFGRVILPLSPVRQNLSAEILSRADQPAGPVLRHRALVLDGEGRALAEVIETYQAVLITGTGE